jgi:hypothetical protein
MMTRLLAVAAITAVIVAAAMYFLAPEDSERHVDVSIESIQRVAELATIRFNEAVLYPYKQPKKKMQLIVGELLVLAKGSIVGRVDLKKASMERDDEARTVTIRFAKGAVLISDPEVTKLETITIKKGGVFHPIKDEHRNEATKNAMGLLKSAAEDAGIRQMTIAEAKTVLSAFVREFGYTASVEFAE